MASKYVDTSAIIQIIGCVFNKLTILDASEKYIITDDDFPEEFHKIVFGAMFKLHELGAKETSLASVNDFLSSRPKALAIFKQQRGDEWLLRVAEAANESTFDYYYSRLKKMTLLRAYDSIGVDVTDLYDPDNILDVKKKQAQEDLLDNSSLEGLADRIDNKISAIRLQYVEGDYRQPEQAGEGIESLIDKFKKTPEVGVPLFGPLTNTVTRGARLKKFYLRSAATGVGKSRTLIADACYISCERIFYDEFGWVNIGTCEPTIYITTEQELEEVQTMMLAFISNVNEDHILNGYYIGDEEERVREAAKLLRAAPLHVVEMPDFSIQDIENTIKKGIREYDAKYIALDYIHTSMKILDEITRRSGGVKLREDNVLFIISNKLKDICNQYGVFIESATQLSGDWKDSDSPDQNLLRGAKSLADKIDYGAILLATTDKDKEALQGILTQNGFTTPQLKLSIYKNRRGKYKGIYLWCKANLGCCRVEPMFATDYNYNIIKMDDTKIIVDKQQAFYDFT